MFQIKGHIFCLFYFANRNQNHPRLNLLLLHLAGRKQRQVKKSRLMEGSILAERSNKLKWATTHHLVEGKGR